VSLNFVFRMKNKTLVRDSWDSLQKTDVGMALIVFL
jgi:hypothetical protein